MYRFRPVDDARENGASYEEMLSDSCHRSCRLDRDHEPARRRGSGNERQGLPDGAAMPLEGFQENLRLGESLPVAGDQASAIRMPLIPET